MQITGFIQLYVFSTKHSIYYPFDQNTSNVNSGSIMRKGNLYERRVKIQFKKFKYITSEVIYDQFIDNTEVT